MTRRAWLLVFPVAGLVLALVSASRPRPTSPVAPALAFRAIVHVRSSTTTQHLTVRVPSVPANMCVTDVVALVRRSSTEPPSVISPVGWTFLQPRFEDSSDSWELAWRAANPRALCSGGEAGPFGVEAAKAEVLACQVLSSKGEDVHVPAAAFVAVPY
jgi:hypothetical protein